MALVEILDVLDIHVDLAERETVPLFEHIFGVGYVLVGFVFTDTVWLKKEEEKETSRK